MLGVCDPLFALAVDGRGQLGVGFAACLLALFPSEGQRRAVTARLCEELLFRGSLMAHAESRLGVSGSWLVTSVLFGVGSTG